MTRHFQYVRKKEMNREQLFQGDILKRTEELDEVLRVFYPYVLEHTERYPYFTVLTQSCDLFRGAGRQEKAEHITLAAMRPIQLFLGWEVAKLQDPRLKKLGYCLHEKKQAFRQRIQRLLSNEEQPYFYYHPSAETPFAEAHVTYLRIAIPLRSDPHYDICLRAKRAELSPVFRAKLGWLTTLVYGRVATQDFEKRRRDSFASEYIDSIEGIRWIKGSALQEEVRRQGLSGSYRKLDEDQLKQVLESLLQKSRPEAVADLVAQVAAEIWPEDAERLEILRKKLARNKDFKQVFTT